MKRKDQKDVQLLRRDLVHPIATCNSNKGAIQNINYNIYLEFSSW